MSQHPSYADPSEALNRGFDLYREQTDRIITSYQSFLDGAAIDGRVRGFYPELSFDIRDVPVIQDRTQAYGFCTKTGTYSTTITRPDVMRDYYEEQLIRIVENHAVEIRVGLGSTPIPLPYALNGGKSVTGSLTTSQEEILRNHFDQPDERFFIDEADVKHLDQNRLPMAWFNAARTDRSLNFLKHYTLTDPQYFQKYILFANYADYIGAFEKRALQILQEKPLDPENPYLALVQPGNRVVLNEQVPDARAHFEKVRGKKPERDPQMPAYHLVRKDGLGVSIVNIGVGPSNAKTITDHVATIRPHAWFMIGHCAGLSHNQRIGDYVRPTGFVDETGVIKKIFPELGYVHVPAISEIHAATSDAIETTLDIDGDEYRASVRSGVNVTVDDRNWEAPLRHEQLEALYRRFANNNAISLEMEAGTISANGFKHRVPYGSLLCISDKPLHGQPKMPGMALDFYRDRVIQQFNIAMAAIDNVRQMGDRIHTRQMRSDFAYVPFR